jgi:hypothetical protein
MMHLLWSRKRSTFYESEFYSLRGVRLGPRPAHELRIWLGSMGRAIGLSPWPLTLVT